MQYLLLTDPLQSPLATPNVLLPESVEAPEQQPFTVTCEGRAFLEVFIDFTVTGVSSSHTVGERVVVSEVTSTTAYTARRNITFQALSTQDCGGMVTCTVSSVTGDTSYSNNATATLQVLGE